MKKKIKSILLAAAITSTLAITACEPNVGIDEGRTAEITTPKLTGSTANSTVPDNYDAEGKDGGNPESANPMTEDFRGTDNALNAPGLQSGDVNTADREIAAEPVTGTRSAESSASSAARSMVNTNMANKAAVGVKSSTAGLLTPGSDLKLTLIQPEAVALGTASGNSGNSGNSGKYGKSGNKKIGWGLGKDVDSFNRPVDAVTANGKYGGLDAYFVGANHTEKVIYLTFDEGYENGFTPAILDTLK